MAPDHFPEDAPERVVVALDRFIRSRGWDETYAVLRVEAHTLLSDLADQVLGVWIAEVRQSRDPERWRLAQLLSLHQNILHCARALGINEAWAAVTAGLEQAEQLTEVVAEQDAALWASVHKELGDALHMSSRGDRRRNIELAIACFAEALRLWIDAGYAPGHAATLFSLGITYRHRLVGDRGGNVESAIECYEAALRIFTLDSAPEQYASVQSNLGVALTERMLGEPRQNLERAIACHREALHVLKRDAFPEQWAATMSNLGIAYTNRIEGSRQSNLTEAIGYLRMALRLLTRDRFPLEYATSQAALGDAFANRVTGSQRYDIEMALRCYRRALDVFTEMDFPQQFAMTQNRLGASYAKRIARTHRRNMERAIQAFRAALQVSGLENAPGAYVAAQTNLGNALLDRDAGDRRENVEASIACFTEALRVYTFQASPQEYALAQNGLASAYHARLAGNRRENLEASIAASNEALRFFTCSAMPAQYAGLMTNLGATYVDRIVGSRRDNIEEALYCFDEALHILTPSDYPKEYAGAQSNRGIAYRDRVEGNRAENLEMAIDCYREALRVYSFDAFPLEHARVQSNLGVALVGRLLGTRRENLEAAIACFEAALRLRTRVNLPEEHAATLINLGNVYVERIAGEREENLRRAEAYLRDALEIFTFDRAPVDWARIQVTLGNVYQRRLGEDRRVTLDVAIAHYRAALGVYTAEDYPINFRDTQLNLAWLAVNALAEEAEGRRDDPAARAAYLLAHDAFAAAREVQEQLGWLERDASGRARLQGEHMLIREMYGLDAWCLWHLGRPREAATVLEAGRAQAVVEAQMLAGVGLEDLCAYHRRQFTEAQREWQRAQERGERAHLRAARDALLAARRVIREHCKGDFLPGTPSYRDVVRAAGPDQALMYLAATARGGFALVVPPMPERPSDAGAEALEPLVFAFPYLTTRRVDGWLLQRDATGAIVGGLRIALDDTAGLLLQSWVSRAEDAAEERHRRALPLTRVPTALRDTMPALRTALERWIGALCALEQALASGSPHEIAQAQDIQALLMMSLGEALASDTLDGMLGWFMQEAELDRILRDMSESFVSDLRTQLTAAGLADPEQPIALIPCGRLGILPIHAAPVRDPVSREEVPLAETCMLALQANARMLAAARAGASSLPAAGPVIGVGDPCPTSAPALGFAEAEVEAVALLAHRAGRATSRAISGTLATRDRVLAELAAIRRGRTGAWMHLATHGSAEASDPQNCYVLLADDLRLTLADLQRRQLLVGLRGFIASACVTAVGDLDTAPDELGSFAAGLLQAGAPCAIATLWSVHDQASFLLMLRFYQLLLGDADVPPSRALRDAARWLRTATRQDLHHLAQAGLQALLPVAPDSRQAMAFRLLAANTGGAPEECVRAIAETLRHSAAEALKLAQDTGLLSDVDAVCPYAHPIYWGAAVMYGA